MSACLSKYHTMNAYGGVVVYLHTFFILVPDGVQLDVPRALPRESIWQDSLNSRLGGWQSEFRHFWKRMKCVVLPRNRKAIPQSSSP